MFRARELPERLNQNRYVLPVTVEDNNGARFGPVHGVAVGGPDSPCGDGTVLLLDDVLKIVGELDPDAWVRLVDPVAAVPTLTFPPADRTSRPDIPVADAYLIDGAEWEVVDADYFSLPFASDVGPDESVTPLIALASFDHGLRCGDETSAVIGIECAAQVLAPLLHMLGVDARGLDWWASMTAVLELDGWTGGWLDESHGEYAHEALYDWQRDMESAAGDAGIIVETSGDVGMTWLYAPMCEPIGRPSND